MTAPQGQAHSQQEQSQPIAAQRATRNKVPTRSVAVRMFEGGGEVVRQLPDYRLPIAWSLLHTPRSAFSNCSGGVRAAIVIRSDGEMLTADGADVIKLSSVRLAARAMLYTQYTGMYPQLAR